MKVGQLIVIIFICFLVYGCSDEENNDKKDVTSDARDTTLDTGNPRDTQTGEDIDVKPDEEEFYISFFYKGRMDDNRDQKILMLIDQDGDDVAVVTPSESGLNCQLGCFLSPDLENIFFQEDPAGEQRLMMADLDENYQVDISSKQAIATGVTSFQTSGDRLIFMDTERNVFLLDLNNLSSPPEALGGVISEQTSNGNFFLPPSGDELFMFRCDLSSMTASSLNLDTKTETSIVTFGTPGSTGSFYSGNEPMAVSPDGSMLAVLLTGLVNKQPCANYDECSAELGEECNQAAGFCQIQMLTLNIVGLNNLGDLGLPCSGEADCDPRHRCDFRDPESAEGVCMPGVYELGKSLQSSGSCLTARAPDEYNKALRSPGWTGDSSRFVFLTKGYCAGFNIDNTAIISVDPTLQSIDYIQANPGQNFPGDECWDPVEEEIIFEKCVVEAEYMVLSPEGHSVVFTANFPPTRRNDREVWIVPTVPNGEKKQLSDDILYEASVPMTYRVPE